MNVKVKRIRQGNTLFVVRFPGFYGMLNQIPSVK